MQNLKVGRLQKSKQKVKRNYPIENILTSFDNNNQSVLLEFEYENEEGTGLGPTLEMYSELGIPINFFYFLK